MSEKMKTKQEINNEHKFKLLTVEDIKVIHHLVKLKVRQETAKEIFEKIENFLYFFQAELKKQKLIPVTLEIEKTLGWKELKKQFLEDGEK